VQTILVISDDNSRSWPPTRLISVAALLRRYSVTFLLSLPVTNHNLLTIRFCCAKVVNSTRLCSGESSRLMGNPNKCSLKIYPLIFLRQIFLATRQNASIGRCEAPLTISGSRASRPILRLLPQFLLVEYVRIY
jgi:hypothetical protein